MFCTSCSARVGGVEDQAEPVTFPVGDAPATAPAGQHAPQGASAHMAAQSRYEEPLTEPAEASQPFVPTPQPKKPKHRGRIVAAVIGGVAVIAIVAAIVVVTRIGASSEVTSGGKGYVVCACETKILPKNSKGKKKSTTTMKVDYAKEVSDALKNVELTQSKKEAKASANSKVSIHKTIATVATTLEQLKSKDADSAQSSYEAISATQDVNFTGAVG